MVAHGGKSCGQSQNSGNQENPERYICSVGKVFQPAIHSIIGQRPGDRTGQKHSFHEFLQQHQKDTGYRSPEHFSDSDLQRTATGALGRQIHEVHASNQQDKDSDQGEHIDVFDPVLAFSAEVDGKIRVEMNIFHRLEKKFSAGPTG